MADRNLVRRVSFAAVAIPLALGIVWLGGWPMTALVATVSALGVRELFDLAERQAVRPARALGIATAAAIPVIAYLTVSSPAAATAVSAAWPYALALWLVALLTWALATRHPTDRPLATVAVTLFAVAYAGALPAFLLDLRHSAHGTRSWAGTWLTFFPLVVIWICDTAAMFGGRAIGGPKLAPTVSPGKTRSGAVAGLAGGLLTVPLFSAWFFPATGVHAPTGACLVVALVISVLGQVGDLAESLFKREVGVKDSSALIPGHGGVLDRFDSLYFAVPLAAACYRLLGIG